MSRLEALSPRAAGPLTRFVDWLVRRRFGRSHEPLLVTAHHPSIFKGVVAFELMLERSRLVDAKLKALTSVKAAALIGCPF
jgi:hypothetical protein